MITDINAEVIVADILEDDLPYEEILVKHEGLFKRNYSKDVLDAYYDMLNRLLIIHISRDSLYDILPHGMFHHMFSDFKSENRQSEFVKLKQEEKNARKLFLPFDYEFFIQYIEIELELRKYFNNPTKFFEDLLLLDRNVPKTHAVKLAGYMLFTDLIIGNPDLTASVLSDILQEEVQHTEVFINEKFHTNDKSLIFENINVGESLGVNYICGYSVTEPINIWEFTVLLKDVNNLENYIIEGSGSVRFLIDVFYDYFTPYEVEVRTRIGCKHQNSLTLKPIEEFSGIRSEDIKNNYLGYNTII